MTVKSPLLDAPPKRIKLTDVVAEYKGETKEHKSPRTYLNYARSLDLFAKGCHKTYVDEVGRGCLMAFAAALKKDGNGERTVFNRFSYVYTFLKRHGKAGIVGKNDWPKFEETESEIYSDDDVKKMLAACESAAERALILFASGMCPCRCGKRIEVNLMRSRWVCRPPAQNGRIQRDYASTSSSQG